MIITTEETEEENVKEVIVFQAPSPTGKGLG